MDEKKIIDALETIKEVCEKQEGCAQCPLYSESLRACEISCHAPSVWKIVEKKAIWRLFL